MTQPPAAPLRVDTSDPVVVLAADDRFAMPLAATVRSALENLSPRATLQIYLLDAGIHDETKERLRRSWPAGRYRIEYLRVDDSALAGMPVSGHVNLVSYYRILIPRLLPRHVDRVIYLDADLIVRGDLARLWQCDLADRLCLAAQDCAAPYMDSSQVLPNYRGCAEFLGAARPVPNFRELGLSAAAPYFNAGVLLVNLAAWRAADLPRQLLACLAQNENHVRWWDQYAMNVVLAGQWGPLDMRWNQGSHAYAYPSWEQSPFDRERYDQLRDDPYIVHFTTRHKPWRASCRHPLRKEFFDVVDRTDWAGWRLPRWRVMLDLVRSQERNLRRGRKWLERRVGELLRSDRGERAA
ncbi:MAG: glycosyltransferase family 8 protein [Pirellulales bacterium]